MIDIDPHFAAGDPRAALFESLVHLSAKGPTREELVDTAVWASDLYGVDYVARIKSLNGEEALEALIIAAHDGFMCECCGRHTLERPSTRSSHQICTVCGWEDSPPSAFGYDGSNGVDLDAAQQNFRTIGACEREWVELVSSAKPGQTRDNGFSSLAARRERLLGDLEDVFDSDEPNPGMTLEDARAADDYNSPRPEYDYERSQTWREVTDERIDQVDEWLFLDKPGSFFYLPALLRFMLRNERAPGNGDALSSLFWFPEPNPGWVFEYATERQIGFLAEALALLTDPWLEQSGQWFIYSPNDDTREAFEAIAKEARRLSS